MSPCPDPTGDVPRLAHSAQEGRGGYPGSNAAGPRHRRSATRLFPSGKPFFTARPFPFALTGGAASALTASLCRTVGGLLLAVTVPLLAASLLLPATGRCGDGARPTRLSPLSSHILFDDDQPPYAYRPPGETHRARGIYPELAAEAFRRMGQKSSMEPAPWARALTELDSGRAGVCGLYATGPRLLRYDFSAPVFEESLHLVIPVGADLPGPLTGLGGNALAALRGMRLGVVRGWSYGDALDTARAEGSFTTEEAGSEAQNMLKVAGGRLDGAIVTREGATWLRERLGLTRLVIVAPQPLAVLPVHLAFRRQDMQHHLLRAFDAAIREMKADGAYARIVERALNGQ